MKLHIVPARQGILWVKLGMRTFFRQPLALTGLFFIFMAVMSVISMVPVIGNVLALALLPITGTIEITDIAAMKIKNKPVSAKGGRKKVRMPSLTQRTPWRAGTI